MMFNLTHLNALSVPADMIAQAAKIGLDATGLLGLLVAHASADVRTILDHLASVLPSAQP